MNLDVELNPDALAEGLSYLRSNPDVAIVCPSATEGTEVYNTCANAFLVF